MKCGDAMKGRYLLGLILAVPALTFGQAGGKGTEESTRFGQAIADALRNATGASIAFVPSGMMKDSLAGKDLAQALEFPEEEVSVVKISGAQVKQALERSISLYPTASPGFLHVSGLEVVFNPSSPSDKRVVSATVAGAALDPGAEYRVAMPASLARGGLGYFTVWARSAVEVQASPKTLDSILRGLQPSGSASRWKAAPSAEAVGAIGL